MNSNPIRSVTPSKALALGEDPSYRFVDVRTVAEFEHGHVAGSYNVPILFHGPDAYGANPDFVDVIKRHFPEDADLIFI